MAEAKLKKPKLIGIRVSEEEHRDAILLFGDGRVSYEMRKILRERIHAFRKFKDKQQQLRNKSI